MSRWCARPCGDCSPGLACLAPTPPLELRSRRAPRFQAVAEAEQAGWLLRLGEAQRFRPSPQVSTRPRGLGLL